MCESLIETSGNIAGLAFCGTIGLQKGAGVGCEPIYLWTKCGDVAHIRNAFVPQPVCLPAPVFFPGRIRSARPPVQEAVAVYRASRVRGEQPIPYPFSRFVSEPCVFSASSKGTEFQLENAAPESSANISRARFRHRHEKTKLDWCRSVRNAQGSGLKIKRAACYCAARQPAPGFLASFQPSGAPPAPSGLARAPASDAPDLLDNALAYANDPIVHVDRGVAVARNQA